MIDGRLRVALLGATGHAYWPAATARTLAIIGLVVGALGLLTGVAALTVGRRTATSLLRRNPER